MPPSGRRSCQVFLLALATSVSSLTVAQDITSRVADSQTPVSGSIETCVEECTYDFSEAIAAYVRNSDLPPDEAREMALRLLATPLGSGQRPIRQTEVGSGKFKILATHLFHAQLPGMIEWMKNDLEQICIEARTVIVTEEMRRTLHSEFAEQWEFNVCSKDESEDLQAAEQVAASPPNGEQKVGNSEMISSTTNIVKSVPTRVTQLTGKQVKSVLDASQAENRTNVLCAPKVTLCAGVEAVIKDVSQRPFVVAVKLVEGNMCTAKQPIVQVFEEGLSIKVRASICDNGKLDFDSAISLSEIGGVDAFTFKAGRADEECTVQVPEQHISLVHVSMTVEDGATLLIDPQFVTEKVAKNFWGGQTITRRYTLLFLRPTVIREKPEKDVGQNAVLPISISEVSRLTRN